LADIIGFQAMHAGTIHSFGDHWYILMKCNARQRFHNLFTLLACVF